MATAFRPNKHCRGRGMQDLVIAGNSFVHGVIQAVHQTTNLLARFIAAFHHLVQPSRHFHWREVV
jgi:hypothetical protein